MTSSAASGEPTGANDELCGGRPAECGLDGLILPVGLGAIGRSQRRFTPLVDERGVSQQGAGPESGRPHPGGDGGDRLQQPEGHRGVPPGGLPDLVERGVDDPRGA